MKAKLPILIGCLCVLLFLMPIVLGVVLVYGVTPAHLRRPTYAHHHFRMQLIVEGNYIDFSKPLFQEQFVSGVCTSDLTKTPIHVHDNKDQFIHIHWGDITGGEVLKYYGFNRIGGIVGVLGYRIDRGFIPQVIPIHTHTGIPSSSSPMHVYQINTQSREVIKRREEEFLMQDLESFFGVQSNLTIRQEDAARDRLNIIEAPRVHAVSNHENHSRSMEEFEQSGLHSSEHELKKLNNFIGDVVIFVQVDEPRIEHVQERIQQFVALEETQCGG